mgnify:CR=1 FL=1
MKSKYSPRIYEFLKCNEFKKQGYVEIDINNLRKLLKAESIYPRYNDFKRFVILKAQKELKKLTDIKFTFEELKTSRKITSLKFYIESNKAKNEMPSTVEQLQNNDIDNIKLVKSIIHENITDLETSKILKVANGDTEKIKEKYNIISKMNKVSNVVGAIIQALKENWTTQSKTKIDNFNNYEQREYDFDKLENKLLGWD